MSVYLFTYHTYSSWLPDRSERYVWRREDVLPTNETFASVYRGATPQDEVRFDDDHQRKMIDIVIDSQARQAFRCFGIATDATQLHVLVAWVDRRDHVRMRSAIKASLTRGLNREFGKHDWLSEGGSCKRVRNRTHFDYLMEFYLPKHRGLIFNALRSGPYDGPAKKALKRA